MSLMRIPVGQARVGMFVHALDAPWISHALWRSRFALERHEDVAALQASGAAYCWIDPARGAVPARTDDRPPAHAGVVLAGRTEAPVASGPMAQELPRAQRLVADARATVATLFEQARLGKAIALQQAQATVDDLAASVARNPNAVLAMARLKRRDDYTFMHSVAVCALMLVLAREHGMAEEQVRLAGLAGLLHDIGKMHVPRAILHKPGALTTQEFGVMQSHPERGADLLVAGGWVPDAVLDVCLHHHEKIDGSGYPHGLAGEQIGRMARMAAVCDVYDAVTSHRPYKQAWDPALALARMAQWQGHFDPQVLQAFSCGVGVYPLGALVRLASDRLAVVVETNPGRPTAPKVRIFYSARAQLHLPVRVLDLARAGAADTIAGMEDPAAWGFKHLEELWRPQAPS